MPLDFAENLIIEQFRNEQSHKSQILGRNVSI